VPGPHPSGPCLRPDPQWHPPTMSRPTTKPGKEGRISRQRNHVARHPRGGILRLMPAAESKARFQNSSTGNGDLTRCAAPLSRVQHHPGHRCERMCVPHGGLRHRRGGGLQGGGLGRVFFAWTPRERAFGVTVNRRRPNVLLVWNSGVFMRVRKHAPTHLISHIFFQTISLTSPNRFPPDYKIPPPGKFSGGRVGSCQGSCPAEVVLCFFPL